MSGRIVNVRPKPGYVYDGQSVVPYMQDNIVNLLTARGTSADRTSHNFWLHTPMPVQQIEAAYRSSWLIAKIVDLPPMDMVREWREWEVEEDVVKKIEAEEKRLKIMQAILDGLVYGRLGGGVVILGTNGNMAEAPRPNEKLLYVKAFPRSVITLGDWDWDIGSSSLGEPGWFVLNGQKGGDRIHPDRILVFKGERVPGITGVHSEATFWGDSVIERVDRAVKNAQTVGDGFSALVDEAKLDVYKFAGLAELLLQPDGMNKALARVEATNVAKSIHRATMMDKDDVWETRELTWSGMPDMVKTYLAIVAGAADIPATRLLGKAPDGQNATGEHDEKNYRGMIATRQNMVLRPALEKLDRLLLPSIGAAVDALWKFSPLDTPSEKEQADIDKLKAETAKIYADTGLVPIAALEKGVQNRLVEDGTFPGLAEALAEMPELHLGMPDDPNPSELVEKGGDRTSAGEGGNRLEAEAARRAANDKQMGLPFTDATPRSLYVRRDLLNADDVIAWARKQGFSTTVDDMHVTIAYSRQAIDWMKIESEDWGQNDKGGITIKPGGVRLMEQFDGGAVVLVFGSSHLSYRHERIKSAGASWDHPDYQPHVTITYDPGSVDVSQVEPYRGELRFGPEIFEEVDDNWKAGVSEE